MISLKKPDGSFGAGAEAVEAPLAAGADILC